MLRPHVFVLLPRLLSLLPRTLPAPSSSVVLHFCHGPLWLLTRRHRAPQQGNAGVFEDVAFIDPQPAWSYTRKSRIGYGRMQVHNASHLLYEARELETGDNMDAFWIVK